MALSGVGFPLCGCARENKPMAKQSIVPLLENVNGCVLDPERLAPLRECMECCGPENPTDEWDHSCIHPRAGAYSCGRLAYPGGPNEHDHHPEEVARCRRLASDAGAVCSGLEVNWSEGSSALAPFFITANRTMPAPPQLTPDVVRAAFGGTIYPPAQIDVEPLEEGSRGWQAIADSDDGELRLPPGAERHYTRDRLEAMRKDTRAKWEERTRRWRAVLEWFRTRDGLRGTAFVLVGENPLSRTNFGCVFPRLILGITAAGSLVGVCGHAVHT
jgi:hypothetical protein